jgi:hypothetical protein
MPRPFHACSELEISEMMSNLQQEARDGRIDAEDIMKRAMELGYYEGVNAETAKWEKEQQEKRENEVTKLEEEIKRANKM